MGRLIDEDDAINAILREYNADDSDYPTDYQQGLHAAKKIIEKMPSAQTDVSDTDGDMISRKFMHDLGATCIARRDDDGKLIALGRIDMLPSVQPEQLTDNEKRIFLAAMTREELMCLQIDEESNGPNLVNLVEICHEITRKVKGALWI